MLAAAKAFTQFSCLLYVPGKASLIFLGKRAEKIASESLADMLKATGTYVGVAAVETAVACGTAKAILKENRGTEQSGGG